MARYVMTIRELGADSCWLLVNQALGIKDAKMQSDFMVDRVALLLFARQSLPERLCVTAAVRQMSGTTIYQGNQCDEWRKEVASFQEHLLPILGYHMDCLYIYGMPVINLKAKYRDINFPVINAGSPTAHPSHALADIACMMRLCKHLEQAVAAWVGYENGTLYSLVSASAWFPFKLRVALPSDNQAARLREIVDEVKGNIEFVSTPEEAVRGAQFIFAGRRGDKSAGELVEWSIDENLFHKAAPDARLMLCASPMRAVPISPELLSSHVSLLIRQAEFRLRVHKRILHWVFDS